MPRLSFRNLPFICVVLLCLTLQGCSSPRPFHGTDSLIPDARSGLDSHIICVSTIPELPESLSTAYATALVETLLSREHLANHQPKCPTQDDTGQASTLQATLHNKVANQVDLHWKLILQNGQERTFQQHLRLPPSPRAWPNSAKTWAKQTADELKLTAPLHRSIRSIYDGIPKALRDKYQIQASDPKPAKPEKLPVFVAKITGADTLPDVKGDANLMMRYAIIGYLRRAGFAPKMKTAVKDTAENTAQAPYQIEGQITLSEPRAVRAHNDRYVMQQNMRIVWTVFNARQKKLGNVQLANDVPTKVLNKNWRQVSDAVAASSINGIVQILNRAEMSQPVTQIP